MPGYTLGTKKRKKEDGVSSKFMTGNDDALWQMRRTRAARVIQRFFLNCLCVDPITLQQIQWTRRFVLVEYATGKEFVFDAISLGLSFLTTLHFVHPLTGRKLFNVELTRLSKIILRLKPVMHHLFEQTRAHKHHIKASMIKHSNAAVAMHTESTILLEDVLKLCEITHELSDVYVLDDAIERYENSIRNIMLYIPDELLSTLSQHQNEITKCRLSCDDGKWEMLRESFEAFYCQNGRLRPRPRIGLEIWLMSKTFAGRPWS